jgi:hypothetical protein
LLVAIDFTARLSHYLDHLAPVWRALPDSERGTFWTPEGLVDHAERLGVEANPYRGERIPWRGGGPILVAATQDVRRAAPTGRRLAYLPHGVGQSFVDADGGRHRGYGGGAGYESVSLFLAPNERNAALWRASYPGAEVVVTGCPKLGGRARETGPRGDLVVVSFHWKARIGIPEAGSAFDEFRPALSALARRGRLALHAHPRIRRNVRQEAARLGVPFVETFEEVLDTAAVYVNDASSTLYEFAAFGGPVVVMHSRAFRREVEHGVRFWEFADVGVQVDRAGHLAAAVGWALEDNPIRAERRRAISRELYPFDDPAERAASAVLTLSAQHPAAVSA